MATAYVRVCVPPPQASLHVPNAPQFPAQFTAAGGGGGGGGTFGGGGGGGGGGCGQAAVLQAAPVAVSPVSYGHSRPPPSAARATVYVCWMRPPPHGAEQAPSVNLGETEVLSARGVKRVGGH